MQVLKGFVDNIIFQNAENGYTVMVLIVDGIEVTCVGTLRGISEGETIEAEGEFVNHNVYGKQFKISTYHFIPPEDELSIERYLGSGAIKGIGPALASRIVKKFKRDSFRIIEEEPERLMEVKGISERIAREIASQVEDKREMREAFVFLQQYNISNTLAVKIYEKYGPKLYTVLRENPYKLAEDISGVGFKMADEIAQKAGIRTDSDFRVRSGIYYALLQASADGHVYLPEEQLVYKAIEVLGVDAESVKEQLPNLMMEKKIVIKEIDGVRQIYATSYYYCELNCARMLSELNVRMASEEALREQEPLIKKKIDLLEKTQKIELDDLQKYAILQSVKNGVFILSGGPGTGKTTTINSIIQYFETEDKEITLAAPTGRASKRMQEATGYEAKTIHRLLELSGASLDENKKASFERNEENPLEADVIIIDEMSMVDIFLFQALLKAVSVGTRLILVGDVNQLPSVGPGQVLRDLIKSQAFPVVVLQKIFRQAEESDIVMNAHRIHSGEQIRLDNKSKDFFFLERNDVNVIYKHMVQLITEKLPRYVNASPKDIQVLTPMRKGNLGVETLNRILQKYINPPSSDKKEHIVGDVIYREGDKVMQIKNNYQMEWEILSKYQIPIDKGMGVFNGDTGMIREIREQAQSMVIEFDDNRQVTYGFSQLDEIEHAYAVTIHKSQGSEYPAVIMPILSGPRMLFNRNLLYTGITRAKNCVTILGSSQTVMSMIENENEQNRYTGLQERIKEILQFE